MEGFNAEEERSSPKKEVKIFGKNIAEIACFRNSFICGICTGVAGGLIAFMMTSKALVSSHTAFASLWIGVFVYWIPCRYKYESSVLMSHEWKRAWKVKRQEEESNKQATDNVSSTESSEKNK